MKTTQNSTAHTRAEALGIPMLIGAGIGLILISFFVFGAGQTSPEWGKFWMIRPLLISPIAGALGGAFYHYMNSLAKRGMNTTVTAILSMSVFIITIWLGIVFGLAGTMWD